MGIFSRIKDGIASKANAAIDKAVDPAKELELAIAELEDGRKKALAELLAYKTTAKQLDADMEKHKAKAAEWEKRAMLAIRAGDDEAAKAALREKKAAEAEAAKIEHDKHEAASYAIQLNKSRKEFETKLQMLKLRKGTLATQLAAARSAGGDAFGNDRGVWDRFQDAEDRIDSALIASEVDSAMRGEDAAVVGALEAKLAKLALAEGAGAGTADDDPLAQLKAKYPGITVVSSNQYAGATRETAKQAAENLLNRFGADLQGIFTPNESSSIGMLLALQDIGKAGKIRFVGFDATQTLLDAMKAGQLDGIAVQNPMKMGYLGVKTMLAHLRNQPFEKRIDTGVTMVTPETLEKPEVQEIIHPPIDKYLKGS